MSNATKARATFTPGPWFASERFHPVGINGHDHAFWAVEADGIGCAVVVLPDEDDKPKARAERQATARLIAAAPDLLAALEGLMAYPMDAEWEREVAAAHAAIARARGES